MSAEEVKFVVDTMLGDLARWLRMLGYDVVYSRKLMDWQILRIAEKDNRIILTRDRGLHARALKKKLKSTLISSDNIEDRLYIVAKKHGIRLYILCDKTRCPICNAPLVKVNKDQIANEVPKPVYERYYDFWKCPKCGKVYWRGRHWIKIEEILDRVRKRLERNVQRIEQRIRSSQGNNI